MFVNYRVLKDRNRIPRPNNVEQDSTIILDDSVVFTAELIEPLSYYQAMQSEQSEQWTGAMNEKLTSLKRERDVESCEFSLKDEKQLIIGGFL